MKIELNYFDEPAGAPCRFFCYANQVKQNAREYFLKKLQSKSDAADRVVNTSFDVGKVKKIHLVGICGKAMASLAGLLVRAGYNVTGSEASWNPPMSTVLEHLGISFKPFSVNNLGGVDLVVMGNAYSSSNIEAQEARIKNIPQISSAEAYAVFFIQNSKSIVIAGTHGKTTTSGIASHVFIESGEKTNALVGGVLSNIGESYYYGGPQVKYSVVEGDEYDTAYFDKSPKFLHYRPTIGVITSIEFDHADIYNNMEDYVAGFVFFASEIPENGYLLINEVVKQEYINEINEVCKCNVLTYGFSNKCDIVISNDSVDLERGGQCFDITFDGVIYKDFFIPLFGRYNIENTVSVAVIAIKECIDIEKIKKSLSTFSGTEQRQQVLFNKNNIVVISDFAHHPTAVEHTIAGVRDHYPNRRIIAVFEPRSSTSRRKDFEDRYGESFDKADIAIISKPPVKEVDNPSDMMDVERVSRIIGERGVDSRAFSSVDEIYNNLIDIISTEDIVLIMSNGTFDGLAEKVTSWLER